jgi:hypothetical protein
MTTANALTLLRQIAQAVKRPLFPWGEEIVAQDIGIRCGREHNQHWLVHTRPIVEAFLHAKYCVEMMVKYRRAIDVAGQALPHSRAAILVLYNQR